MDMQQPYRHGYESLWCEPHTPYRKTEVVAL